MVESRTQLTKAGAMLQKAIMPLGVEGGTRSRAAESMITYKTSTRAALRVAPTRVSDLHTIVHESKNEKREAEYKTKSISRLAIGVRSLG